MQLERRLRAQSAAVDRLAPDLDGWFDQYLDAGEYGLAVEIVAERLGEAQPRTLAMQVAKAILPDARAMALPRETIRRLEDATRRGAS